MSWQVVLGNGGTLAPVDDEHEAQLTAAWMGPHCRVREVPSPSAAITSPAGQSEPDEVEDLARVLKRAGRGQVRGVAIADHLAAQDLAHLIFAAGYRPPLPAGYRPAHTDSPGGPARVHHPTEGERT